jgi:chromatin remodeling complex protein RSC6
MPRTKAQKSDVESKKETVKDVTEQDSKDDEPVEKKSSKKEPVKKEPVKKESAKKEAPKKEPVKKEASKKEASKKEPVKKETVKKEPSKKKSVKKDEKDETDETVEKEPRKRTVPTKDSVSDEFDELISSIEQEIARLRETQGKAKGVKFLRCVGKRIKMIKGHAFRVLKEKKKTNRKNNTNSGFLKPVLISKEMADFTGWDANELRSRVDVTKFICNYIRDNDLQNPQDRRQIIVDKKLSDLLQFVPTDKTEPLTYYRIQSYIKKHFSNPSK